jgi:tagatose-1,6-bisphosphate aldolase
MTTIGKYRHLSQCSTPAGHFVILAIDHRANLRGTLDKYAPTPVTDAQFTGFKQQVIQHLLPPASAVLTDPSYGIGPGIAEHTIGGQYGVIAPIEVTDYEADPSHREINFIPGWSVAKIKLSGGTGV